MKLIHAARLCAVVVASLAATAFAHEYKLGAIEIDHPWARATVPGQSVGGGYVKLVNEGATADRLLAASSPAAARVELHTHEMGADGVARMRPVAAIELPAKGAVELKPGGLHLMLLDLKQPLVVGQRVPITLRFERAGETTVELAVQAVAPAEEMHKH
ncbi:copper chaperone PCu(A)C [Derxia lacustris]|uniref:copper chaperone PCu(A)C n=1 Tax=Derxia lacustris TaxID=764842 RepID=UPI000A16FD92|nr:copper chaperone PCu(A)C [Derxia lacustris]